MKNYLTKEGLERVKKELEKLREQRSILLNGSGPRAFRFGEIDAEYFAFREDLERIEERIAELENVLENYELIKTPPKEEQNKIHLGATVLIEMDGEIEEFTIVSKAEADAVERKISDQSPIGKVLLGKKVGEEVRVQTPMINHVCRILKIRYGDN